MRIQTKTHIGSDGTLLVQVPTNLREIDVDVALDVQPRMLKSLQQKDERQTPEELGWPPEFFERTYGSLSDDQVERLPQGDFEEREAPL